MPARLPHPVIVVPGITATYLDDAYALPPETVWSVMTNRFERISLHPDHISKAAESTASTRPERLFEASQPSRVTAGQLFEIAYRELIAELRYGLAEREDRPVPVYPFAYDWRQPLALIEAQLAAFIDEVIERTKLLRHYDADGYGESPKVNLVGHSMGGLVIAGCLSTLGAAARVHKVATLATPFQGSFEAVIKVITGTADLGTSPPSSRERAAARLTPALYHLMPSFQGHLSPAPDWDGPTTIFDPAAWQTSVVETIADYIKAHGLNRRQPKAQAAEVFAHLLAEAARHRARIDRFTLASAGLSSRDWLCVVGVGATTRVRLAITRGKTGAEFMLNSKDRADQWTKDAPVPPPKDDPKALTGDGTVPFEGAVPKFLDRRNLVCVTPSDYGYWEIGDSALSRVAGFHGILPNMDMLHRMIIRHFTGRADRHRNTWGWAAPGTDASAWDPPVELGTAKNAPGERR